MTNNDEEEKEQKSALVDQLVDFLRQDGELFHDGEDGYVALERKNRREIYRIHSKDYRNYVSHVAWEQLEKALSRTAKDSILGTLEAIAKFEGEERKLSLRTAWDKNVLWYDLGDWRAVKITKDGWQIVKRPPILFKRYHEGIQCEPVEGGKIEEVFQFLNLEREEGYESAKILLMTYLATSLLPDMPRPILNLHGQQGSAKSTASRLIKSLIDPSKLDAMTMPAKKEELVQMLSHHYCVFFDNLSRLSQEQSDTLCRACTGEGLTKRQLYSDDDDVIYRYLRVIGLNGINLVATKADLLDRSMIFELRAMSKHERMDQETFWRNFNEAKPKILGAIFTAISKAIALKEGNDVKLDELPRLADYARWGARIAIVSGYSVKQFIDAYEGNIETQNEEVVENSAVAQAIMELAKEMKEGVVSFSSEAMFARLKQCAEHLGLDNDRDFPSTPRLIWKQMKIIKANLIPFGIEMRYLSKKRPRQIEITFTKKVQQSNGGDGNDGNGTEMLGL